MKLLKNLVGGLVGAVALNILHEAAKRFDHDAPRIDLVGEEAVSKTMDNAGLAPFTGDSLYVAALAGDLISNALYYSTIGVGNKNNLLLRGAAIGLGAGIGALVITEPIGLSDAPITKTDKTKALTVAWYVFGGVVTALTIKLLRK